METTKKEFIDAAKKGLYYLGTVWGDDFKFRSLIGFLQGVDAVDVKKTVPLKKAVNSSGNIKFVDDEGKTSFLEINKDVQIYKWFDMFIVATIYENSNSIFAVYLQDIKESINTDNFESLERQNERAKLSKPIIDKLTNDIVNEFNKFKNR